MDEIKRALIIGVDNYASLGLLKFAANDAGRVIERLSSVCQFSRKNVRLLRDHGETDAMPTRENILGSLRALADPELWPEGGLFLFYFAGHGTTFAGKGFLAPIDAPDPTSDQFPALSLPVDELRAYIDAIPARCKVILLDACRDSPGRSAGAGPAVAAATKELYGAFRDIRATPRAGEPGALGYFFACHPGQKSWKLYDKQQSVFSYYLCRSLSSEAADASGEITLQSVASLVDKKMEQWSRENPALAHRPDSNYAGCPRIVLGETAPSAAPALQTPKPAPAAAEVPVLLGINANHRYRAGEMGVLEFQIKNQSSQIIPVVELTVECPCEKSERKTSSVKNIPPDSLRKLLPSLQFHPVKGGEALLRIEVLIEDENHRPSCYRGETSIDIDSRDEGKGSSTSFHINIHDIQKFMGNDLSGLISVAGKEPSEDRLTERMKKKDPIWIPVELVLDDEETERRRVTARRILHLPESLTPAHAERAALVSLDPSWPYCLFLYSMRAVRFGRDTRKSDAVLRFLPDFYSDVRSTTISGEQLVAQYSGGRCTLTLAKEAHAQVKHGGRDLLQNENVPLVGESEFKIGSQDFGLRISCNPRDDDPHWKLSLEEIRRRDPAADPYEDSPYDFIRYSRTTNSPEVEYVWLFRKMDIGWMGGKAADFEFGNLGKPRVRLSFWNRRFYLEPLESDEYVMVDNRLLQLGDIACLGAETEIALGPFRFRWLLNPPLHIEQSFPPIFVELPLARDVREHHIPIAREEGKYRYFSEEKRKVGIDPQWIRLVQEGPTKTRKWIWKSEKEGKNIWVKGCGKKPRVTIAEEELERRQTLFQGDCELAFGPVDGLALSNDLRSLFSYDLGHDELHVSLEQDKIEILIRHSP